MSFCSVDSAAVTKNLLDLSLDELRQFIVSRNLPAFRAAQIWRWIYHGLVTDADAMLNLPQELRARLSQEATWQSLQPVQQISSADGLTEKVLLRAADGECLETVLMRYEERQTVCVSSQMGCAMGCAFCATGQQGFVRDLTAGEIVEQVLYYARILQLEELAVTNVVIMGMGEPLLNLDAVLKAIRNLNDPQGLNMGARRFTVSTAGVVPGIERLSKEGIEINLAVSLHAPDDALRERLVPLNRRYPIAEIMRAVRRYINETGRRVTFEYALVRDLNDSDAQAQATAALLKGLLGHVNLIAINPTSGCDWQPSSEERAERFREILDSNHIPVTIRLRRGVDIQAGCGQLRGTFREQAS